MPRPESASRVGGHESTSAATSKPLPLSLIVTVTLPPSMAACTAIVLGESAWARALATASSMLSNTS